MRCICDQGNICCLYSLEDIITQLQMCTYTVQVQEGVFVIIGDEVIPEETLIPVLAEFPEDVSSGSHHPCHTKTYAIRNDLL